ncbi:YkgJ family cysteine cluster protein [Solitalea canadensis]|uniref:Putative Fe-S oxidoreductase n=1 Tax=Solitalea canadensis (strain ATCC 29591 / DSM 3403 / JCM 21819 / LMG 8368 / NBRC 15130 / NCIMB 12057 / USAM 9D) TaxID=929556 RepID=H8KUU6_SOLCM|nr:YkgJ family cysteine cluster protein [Solitalea canadensis]AFD07646.1 putative Fe-S oxidoreductase [Solitalea canadensis DSM 3403]
MIDLNQLKGEAQKRKKENKKYFERLKNKKSREVDLAFAEQHEIVFAKTDCLTCANCCRGTGPLFTQRDIERLASRLKLKPGDFVERYLRIDEDNDYVLRSVPCPFLGDDNYCSVYEDRPKACREYPHTDHSPMLQILDITLKNTTICPAVYEIVERMKKYFPA